MRLSDRLQGLCAQSWAKTGLGKKPYNTKKYGICRRGLGWLSSRTRWGIFRTSGTLYLDIGKPTGMVRELCSRSGRTFILGINSRLTCQDWHLLQVNVFGKYQLTVLSMEVNCN